jgi:signal transduction histidine kinase
LLLGLSILTVLIGAFGFLIFRQQKLKNKQQAQEYDLNQAILKIENQNKLQDQRLSISRDLHDNIGSQLTFIISSVDNVKYGFDLQNDKLSSKLTNISSFAKDTIVELRDTIWAMNSSEITFQDLESRINNYIEKAKEAKENISFSFAIEEDLKSKKLTSVEGMNIYRTIQEAVNNAIKYANAEIISITVKHQENKINISVKDNGSGFDYETIEKGNGLNNMQKRIEEIGGAFALTSTNEGTKIEIIL